MIQSKRKTCKGIFETLPPRKGRTFRNGQTERWCDESGQWRVKTALFLAVADAAVESCLFTKTNHNHVPKASQFLFLFCQEVAKQHIDKQEMFSLQIHISSRRGNEQIKTKAEISRLHDSKCIIANIMPKKTKGHHCHYENNQLNLPNKQLSPQTFWGN